MERQQNIRTASIRNIAKNFALDGKTEIIQNRSGGTMQIRGSISSRSCGCVVADGIDICSCIAY